VAFVWAVLLAVIVLLCWFLTVAGMPGNWLMVIAVTVYVLLVPPQSPVGIGWGIVIALTVMAASGELVEFLASALGVGRAGGSRRGAALALVGSMAGGIVGLFVGLPIPLIGSILGAVLLAGAGAFVGAVVGEQWKGRNLDESCRIGQAAFWGRLLGTAAKTALGAVMVVTTIAALIA
jgi:uncharacterized protein YqgC (DUF456 family)